MLRNRIEDAGIHRNITVGSSELYSVKALLLFYERRMFQPAWMDNDGPRPHVKHLIDAICRADQEGLRPEDYHLDEISGILPEKKYFKWRQPSVNPRQLTDLELLMTDAFLLYGSDLLSGRINPGTIDPEYFTKQNIRVFQGWGAETKEIDPKTVNWSALTPKTFTFRLRQDPGPQNALGRIKFMFPNRFNIYIHDTPYRTLFDKTSRTFSSGCIRIEKPLELAVYLLKPDPKWHPDAIQAALEQGEERTIQLPEPMPVHLLYWTVFVDSNGKLQFRPDIYNRDKRLNDSLRKKAC